MAYLGRQPVIGNFVKLDAITAVNGQAAYTMQNGSVNFADYSTVNQFLVSLNGTIQSPGSSFTVSGSTLTFASNLSTGDVIDFIIVFGNSLSAGTPTDATVSLAKLTATGTKDATTFLRGDNTFASPSGGKVLQVVQAIDTSSSNTTGTTFVGSGTGVSITPSSTSSKIYISVMMTVETQARGYFTIYRDSTNLGDANGLVMNQPANVQVGLSMHYLDSPNTTSAVSYEVYFRSQTSGDTTNAVEPIVLVAMEIGA